MKFVIFLLCAIALYASIEYNDYLTYQNYSVEVVNLYSGISSGKYSSLDFIAVFRDLKTGVLFDRYISPSFYSQLAVGDMLTLNLRPFDVNQTFSQNAIFLFGAMIFQIVTFAVGIVNLCFFIQEQIQKFK